MGKRLEVPADIDFLIEKRENETDRRKTPKKSEGSEAASRPERRKQADRRKKSRKPSS